MGNFEKEAWKDKRILTDKHNQVNQTEHNNEGQSSAQKIKK